MSYSLNSLKVGYIGDCIGDTIGLIKEDTRSLDCSSYNPIVVYLQLSASTTSLMSWSMTSATMRGAGSGLARGLGPRV